MKKTALINVLFVLFLTAASAQQPVQENDEYQSIFASSAVRSGWFIDFNNSYSILNGRETWLPGFSGGMVLDQRYYVGLRFKSFSSYPTYLEYKDVMPEPCYLNGGYVGFYTESAINYNRVVHITFPLTLGGGGAVYHSKAEYPEWDEDELDYSSVELSASPFFVVEPGINLEINCSNFMKFNVGYSYRWLLGLRLDNTNPNAFSQSTLNLGVKFGKF